MNEIETFYGFIDTPQDALRVFELCRCGQLGRVRRRLHDKERRLIRSGSVFVFDERESGIKRWTDGRLWSPSRILGNFLIYRELERKGVHGSVTKSLSSSMQRRQLGNSITTMENTLAPVTILRNFSNQVASLNSDPSSIDVMQYSSHRLQDHDTLQSSSSSNSLLESGWDDGPVLLRRNSLTSSGDDSTTMQSSNVSLSNQSMPRNKYIFKQNGLLKKTLSVTMDGTVHHLVCYYSHQDFVVGKLNDPIADQLHDELTKVPLPNDIKLHQNFRRTSSTSLTNSVVTLSNTCGNGSAQDQQQSRSEGGNQAVRALPKWSPAYSPPSTFDSSLQVTCYADNYSASAIESSSSGAQSSSGSSQRPRRQSQCDPHMPAHDLLYSQESANTTTFLQSAVIDDILPSDMLQNSFGEWANNEVSTSLIYSSSHGNDNSHAGEFLMMNGGAQMKGLYLEHNFENEKNTEGNENANSFNPSTAAIEAENWINNL